MSGTIPPEFGGLTSLRGLLLHNNQLSGAIPSQLGKLTNLRVLRLSGNSLTGYIPAVLKNIGPSNDLGSLGIGYCDARCSNGTVVPDPADNPGLVSDCLALLSSKDTLAGTGSLNWSVDTAITAWDGVTVGGAPRRVTELNLSRRGLTGSIPTELGEVVNLNTLLLDGNRLSGEIPSELGNLTNLRVLDLEGNQLTGCVPSALRDVEKKDFRMSTPRLQYCEESSSNE